MNAAEIPRCAECGGELPPGLPRGLCPRCALQETEQPKPPAPISLPRPFGDYELLEEIARGGMGVVFKARQRSLDRTVAIKMILSGQFAGKEEVLRFRAEAESAARLRHSNIVRIHETGEVDGQPYFSMDYVAGRNLSALVREKPLPAKRAAGYLRTIATAIHYAHEHGILHRDLKPSNVLIDEDDQPHVTDFGLAKRVTKESFLTVTGQVMGSPSFMPPEQAGAKGVKAGRHSDVYGLGAILFYLVTGRPPFVADTIAETLQHVLNTEPVSPRVLNPSVPTDLATICLKCLEKEPGKRYATGQQFADELGRFLNDEPVLARPVGHPERIWRWCRRRRALTATAMLTVAALVIGSVLGLRLWHLERRRTQERRAMAMDNAFLAARSGDLEGAEKAIAAAKLAGAFPGELRLLRGQLAFERGDYREAVRHLEQAALLSRESAAVPAMLSLAYHEIGEWSKSQHFIDVVTGINPRTPEDYLFKGVVEGDLDPIRGLEMLDKAVQMRPSGFALLLRADARVDLVDDYRNIVDAERATAEAKLVQEMLPTSPLALAVCLQAHLAAANTYQDNGRSRQCETALVLAAQYAEALRHFPQSQDAAGARYLYSRSVGDESAVMDVLSHADPKMSMINSFLLSELYARGKFSEAMEVSERGPWTNAATSIYSRGYVLAEFTNGPELALQQLHQLWDAQPTGVAALNIQTIWRLLGRKAEAVTACQSLHASFSSSPRWRNGWYQTLLDYCLDSISEEELLKAAGPSHWNQCEAHFHIALNRLAEGKRDAAREHFRLATSQKVFVFYEDRWSRAFLARMNKDPNWPPWIPVKAIPSNENTNATTNFVRH